MHLNVFWYTNEAGEVVAIDTAPYGEELDKETVFQAYERDIPASVETKNLFVGGKTNNKLYVSLEKSKSSDTKYQLTRAAVRPFEVSSEGQLYRLNMPTVSV